MGTWRTVVGVAADVKLRDLFEGPLPTVYAPLAQLIRADQSLVARTAGSATDIASAIRGVVRDVAPDVPISRMDEMRTLVAASLADQRFRTVLISLFAAIAALLAAVGMYGVAATWLPARRACRWSTRFAAASGARDSALHRDQCTALM
jgi:putative ABC transport system permease protein